MHSVYMYVYVCMYVCMYVEGRGRIRCRHRYEYKKEKMSVWNMSVISDNAKTRLIWVRGRRRCEPMRAEWVVRGVGAKSTEYRPFMRVRVAVGQLSPVPGSYVCNHSTWGLA